MESLRRFNGDKTTKQELKEYIVSFLQLRIIERSMKKENTDSLVDAIVELDKAFNQLDIEYGIPEQKTNKTVSAK